MATLQPNRPAKNFIKLVEEIVSNGDYRFSVVTSWDDGDEVPRIAYRTQETSDEDIWEEAVQFINILLDVYLLEDDIEYDIAPELAIGVTLPHVDSGMDGATGWMIRREWVAQYDEGNLTSKELLHRINGSRHHVVEREMLAAVDGEDSLRWDED